MINLRSVLTIKRVLAVFLGIVAISQLPFAYERYRTSKLSSKIEQLRTERRTSVDTDYRDLRGVFHVHTFLGGHSTGSFDELIAAAKDDKLDFVVMTEHVSGDYDTSDKTLHGRYGNTLWIGGNELSTADGDRFLVIDGFKDLPTFEKRSTEDLLSALQEQGRLAVAAYPREEGDGVRDADGIEVLSLNTLAKRMNPVYFFFDALWGYGTYPELTLARNLRRPDPELAMFDKISANRHMVLFAGDDAHSNIGIHLGDDANNRWIDLKYDRYAMIFRLLRTHVLLKKDEPLTRETLIEAMRQGSFFVSVDALSDPSGFGLWIETPEGDLPMGTERDLPERGALLKVESPLEARIVVFRNGTAVRDEKNSFGFSFKTTEPGAYRAEVYLDSLGGPFGETPWIISNPVFLR